MWEGERLNEEVKLFGDSGMPSAVWVTEKGNGEPQSVETAQEGLIFQAMSHINSTCAGLDKGLPASHPYKKNKAIPMAIIIVILSTL